MASPLDIINSNKIQKELHLPKKIDLAINLIQTFIQNNNSLGLKIAIILAGAREQIEYDTDNGVTFNVDELCRLCRIDRRYLSSNKKKMTDTYYQYVDEQGNLTGTRPIHTFTYMNKNKDIRIEVSSKAKELFSNLKSKENIDGFRFTQAISRNLMIYDLKDVNKHTLKMQMLLEMINNFTTTKKKYFSIEELNGYFGTKYKRYGDIDRKILTPVQKDTLKYSSVSFKKIEKSEVNKIIGVTINIEDNVNLFTDTNETPGQNPGSENQNNLSPKVPTEEDVKYAIDELKVTSQEAEQKYKMFLAWEKSIGKKRSFQKFLLDGKENGL